MFIRCFTSQWFGVTSWVCSLKVAAHLFRPEPPPNLPTPQIRSEPTRYAHTKADASDRNRSEYWLVFRFTDHQTHEPLPPPLHTSLLRMRSLSEPSELLEKISFKEFCFGSDVIWRVGSGLIWRGVRSQVEKRVFYFLQTFLFCSDASVPVWSEQVCGNLKRTLTLIKTRQQYLYLAQN